MDKDYDRYLVQIGYQLSPFVLHPECGQALVAVVSQLQHTLLMAAWPGVATRSPAGDSGSVDWGTPPRTPMTGSAGPPTTARPRFGRQGDEPERRSLLKAMNAAATPRTPSPPPSPLTMAMRPDRKRARQAHQSFREEVTAVIEEHKMREKVLKGPVEPQEPPPQMKPLRTPPRGPKAKPSRAKHMVTKGAVQSTTT